MIRALPACAVLLALAVAGPAQEKSAPTETVIRLKVEPAPAPRPALKYQLLPDLKDLNPGNPIQGYLKCFCEQNPFFFGKESQENRFKWEEMPLKDLPLKEVRHYGGHALAQADFAARLDTPDWQILLKLKRDGYYTLLPDLQQMRVLASALKVRLRGDIADRRFDDAIVTAQTMFALARHLGEHPTLIGNLVAIAVASITGDPLEEMIGQSGSPNLFWALTDLPHPLIDPRKGAHGEHLMLATEMAGLDQGAPMTDARLRQFVGRAAALLHMGGKTALSEKELRQWLNGYLENELYIKAARQRLVAGGLRNEAVKTFPPLQVFLLDKAQAFAIRQDDVLKVMSLPFWQAHAALGRSYPKDIDERLFQQLLGWGHKVLSANARLEQRLGLLRCVEALRIYAAAHDGRLPDKLADINLPLPLDPVTGKAFVYKLEGGAAILRATPPPGMERNAGYNVRYEITIAKGQN
jgi:hypothetical protein